MGQHIVLLGDSIFDNSAYTGGEPDVVSHLRDLLPEPWQATLCAVDGATTSDLESQRRRVPSDASHLIVSIGGNDALENLDLLATPVESTAEALELFGRRASAFESSYRAALGTTRAAGLPITACTIYNGDFPAEEAEPARMALTMFNDAILRVAFENRFDLIDLRSVCSEREDYANPIEPSGPGGRKIAQAILRVVGVTGDRDDGCRVFS